MRTVVMGPRPAELETLIERRRALGQDLFDEVWEGEYHMNPAPCLGHGLVENQLTVLLHHPYARAAGLRGSGPFNLGSEGDYRVPDQGYHRTPLVEVFVPTAAIVAEVVCPDDETYAKFGFYARRGVEELIVADPEQRSVRMWRLVPAVPRYDEVEASGLLSLSASALGAAVDWP